MRIWLAIEAVDGRKHRMAFAFADDFLDGCRAAYDTFAMVRDLFSPREDVELLLLIGSFRMTCGVMTTLEIEVGSLFGAKVLDSVRDPQTISISARPAETVASPRQLARSRVRG
jgi:hypothetical protein